MERDEMVGHVEWIIERLPDREREMLEAMTALEPPERSL